MGEAWNGFSESTIEADLSWRRGNEVRATNHFGDASVGIVDHHRKLICPRAVGTPENEVPGEATGRLWSAYEIVEARRRLVETEAMRRDPIRVGHSSSAGARIARGLPVVRGTRDLRDLFSGAGTGINEPGCSKRAQRLLVRFAPRRLIDWAFVPIEPKPFVIPADGVCSTRNDSRMIDVLDPHDDLAALLARPQPGHQRRARMPGVHLARRRRSEARAILRSHASSLYDLRTGGHAVHLPAVRGRADVCGCFPTGRHYPGIADLIADAIQNVEGLCHEFEPGSSWGDIPVVVIDFETTGRDAETDRVIEIGLVTFERGRVSQRESLLVNPGIPVPEESRAVHGITDEELAGAPDFATVMPRVLDLLQGKLPVAYNAPFDRGFLLAELRRAAPQGMTPADMPPAARDEVIWVDPLVWAREILKELQSRRLGDVTKHLSIPLEQAHRAAGDAEATGRVLLALAPQMPRVYGELIRLQKRYAAFQDAELAAWKRFR